MTHEYVKQEWVDSIPAETPIKYAIVDDSEGTVASSATIAPVTSITPGTPLNATTENYQEEGIYNAQNDANEALDLVALAQADADKGVIAYNWRDSSYTFYLNGNEVLTTTHKVSYHIPNLTEFANGCTLIGIRAYCEDVSTSGNITITAKKNGVSVLTTNITIEAGEESSLTATVQPVIDATKKNFVIGDKILFNLTEAGASVTHCHVEIILRPIEV